MILKNLSLFLDDIKTAFSKGEGRANFDPAPAFKKLKCD
jgi:hypothetical protein